MIKCTIHKFFFDTNCQICKEEYLEFKGAKEIQDVNEKIKTNDQELKLNKYKEFTEERAKKLYEEIFLQYLRKGNLSEEESIERSKKIIKKQCLMRGIEPWSWV